MDNINTDIVYFHGRRKGLNRKKLSPSVTMPFYMADNYEEAKSYGGFEPRVYPIYIEPGTKVFDCTAISDIESLKGKTYYSDETISILADKYANQPANGWNFWYLTHRRTAMEYALKGLKEGLRKEYENVHGKQKYGNIKGIAYIYTIEYVLLDPIFHFDVKNLENPRHHQVPEVCRDCMEAVAPKRLSQVVIENRELFRTTDEYLLGMVIADTMQAIGEDKYPYDFMTYRRIIYQAALDMGCRIIKDTSTTEADAYEYVIIDPKAIRLILSKPLSNDNREKYEKIGRIMGHLEEDGNGYEPITISEFERILNMPKGG